MMPAPRLWFALPLVLVGLAACGDEEKANPTDIFGGSGASGSGGTSASTGFCADYCAAIVTRGTDCSHYNDAHRCESICGFYRDGACTGAYTAFAECMTTATQIGCFLSSSGKWGLEIYECNAEYNAFNSCIEDKDAGVCPY